MSYFCGWNTTKSFQVKYKGTTSGHPGPVLHTCSRESRKWKYHTKYDFLFENKLQSVSSSYLRSWLRDVDLWKLFLQKDTTFPLSTRGYRRALYSTVAFKEFKPKTFLNLLAGVPSQMPLYMLLTLHMHLTARAQVKFIDVDVWWCILKFSFLV